jgi:hypothetical protein
MITLVGVPPGHVRGLWNVAEPHLREAMDRTRGMMTDDSVQRSCQDKENQLWLIDDGNEVVGAAVTEVRNLKTGEKTVHILALGAKDMKSVFECENALKAWAIAQGAERMTMDGRLGWLKALNGWSFVSVMMEKELVRQ